MLHELASDRTSLPWNDARLRTDRMRQLFADISADRIREVRALYIRAYGEDPEIEIITGPAPQAAKNVAQPTIEALARRWE